MKSTVCSIVFKFQFEDVKINWNEISLCVVLNVLQFNINFVILLPVIANLDFIKMS